MLRKVRRHLSFSFFTLGCKPSFSTRLIASFTFEERWQQHKHYATLTMNATFEDLFSIFNDFITNNTDLCISTFPCLFILNKGGRFTSLENMRTLPIFFWLVVWPAMFTWQKIRMSQLKNHLCNFLNQPKSMIDNKSMFLLTYRLPPPP